MRKAFVLLSGGLDSTTALYKACQEFTDVEAISINYGQRHKKELSYASRTCQVLGIKHTRLSLDNIIPKTMLTNPDHLIPSMSYDEIKGVSPTYVPFRNGLLLSAITSHVAGQHPGIEGDEWSIYFGAHAEDAQNWAYPDCTPEWIGAMANAIFIGTYMKIRLHTPLMWLRKSEIVSLGHSLHVDFANTWSCYAGGEQHCGECPTCRARKQAFILAAVKDPTTYIC